MNSLVIVIVATVVSLVMGYLLLACKRSLWPFTKKESFGGVVVQGIKTATECTAVGSDMSTNIPPDLVGVNNKATTSFSNNLCTVTCPSGTTYWRGEYLHNYCVPSSWL